MSRQFIILGAINCFLAVALGAFGAHGLQKIISAEALQTWQTSVQYHSFHGLGLIAVGIMQKEMNKVSVTGWLMLAGIVLFCGSLYLLSLSGIKSLGIITPFGGLCFLAGWLWLIVTTYKFKPVH
ncbi:MAG: DUF423 domain-containing protein [Gammaproteobacteria bacterium]|nr:DUF423 domain-containing protein [Gammaproteobacteria bacterium]